MGWKLQSSKFVGQIFPLSHCTPEKQFLDDLAYCVGEQTGSHSIHFLPDSSEGQHSDFCWPSLLAAAPPMPQPMLFLPDPLGNTGEKEAAATPHPQSLASDVVV